MLAVTGGYSSASERLYSNLKFSSSSSVNKRLESVIANLATAHARKVAGQFAFDHEGDQVHADHVRQRHSEDHRIEEIRHRGQFAGHDINNF